MHRLSPFLLALSISLEAAAQIPQGLPLAMHLPFGGSALLLSYTSTLQCQGGFVVDLTVTGGTPPYQFAWSNGSSIFSNQEDVVLGVGGQSISVAVYDQLGNYSVIDVDAGIPAVITNTPCLGPPSGSIDITPPPSINNPGYQWLGPDNAVIATTEDVTGLAPGEYHLWVYEQPNGCYAYSHFTIIIVPAITGTTMVSPDGWYCEVGAIDLTPSGGTAPYSFTWSQGQTTEDLQGLDGGFYSVLITDALGCSGALANIFIPNAPIMELSATTTSTPVCGAGGTIDLTVTGGVAPYSYSWTPQPSTDQDPTGLNAGYHMVIITDGTGCATSAVFTIPGTASTLAVSANLTSPCSGGHNGSIDITVTGGTAPYMYYWSGPDDTFSNAEDVANLETGNYSVLVADAINCTVIGGFPLMNGVQVLTLSASSTPTCTDLGVLDLSVAGTSGPFAYHWLGGGQTSEDLTNLAAGTYQVQVTDINLGCQAIGIFTVDQGYLPQIVDYELIQDCSGTDVNMTTSSIYPPLTYYWNWDQGNGSASAEDLTDVSSGTYQYTVTDAVGCIAGQTIVVPPSPALELSDYSSLPCSSRLRLFVTGGTGPFSSSWSNGATTQDLPSTTPGDTYTVTVQDQGGLQCSATASFVVPNIQPIVITSIVTPACNSGEGAMNGSIDLTVTGPSGVYTYQWFGPGGFNSTSQDISNLWPGQYSFALTGSYAWCGYVGFYNIEASPIITLNATSTPACNSGTSGSINLTASSGTGSFTFQWSGPGGFSSSAEDPTELASGTYTVLVTDGAGCTRYRNVVVGNTVIQLDPLITDAACTSVQLGSIDITVAGGISPYSYVWSNGTTAEDITDLAVGFYSVFVQDAIGCSLQQTFEVIDASPCCVADRFYAHGTHSSTVQSPASGTIDIQGQFIIDQNFTFENATVYMEPGAEIIQLDGAHLWVINSTFERCQNVMWKGITTGNGCIVQVRGSTIADAESAIQAMNSSIVLVDDSEFNNNRVGIEVPDQGGFNSVAIYSTNSTYYAEGPLAQPYPGQTTAVGQKGYAALSVSDMALDFTGGGNVIHHMSNGIVSNNSDLTVTECFMHDIQPDAAYASPSNGSAIFARGDLRFVTLKQMGFGSTTGAAPAFQNCRWGIYTEYMNVYSEQNTMTNVGTAYHVEKGNSRTIDILYNKLDTRFDGIQLYMNDGCTRMDIANNDITFATNPPPGQFVKGYTAILVKEANVKNPNSVIQNNTIRYRTNATTAYAGIRLTSANNYKVLSNTLVMHNNANNYAGIYTSACDRPLISCNTITGSNTNYNANDGQSAIRNNMGDGVSILCNDVDGTTNGIMFSGATLNTDLSGNNIRRHKWGLHSGASTVIQGQLLKGNLWYNAPQLGGLHALSDNTNAWAFPFTYHPEVIIGGNTEPVLRDPPNWFMPSSGQNYRCDDGQTNYCAQYEGFVCEVCKTELDEKVATGDLENNPYTEETKQILENDLYKKLDNAPVLLANDQELADFYAAMQNTNVAQFKQINDDYLALFHLDASVAAYLAANKAQIQGLMDQLKLAMEELADEALTPAQRQTIMANANGLQLSVRNLTALNDQALALASTSKALQADNVKAANNGVGTTELIETNEKQVKKIYLSTLAKEVDSFTSAEVAALLAIANQCPMVGGNAVYRARSLYALIDDNVEYNDASLCLQHGIIYKSLKPAATAQVSIQPNPASDAATLLYTMAADTHGSLIIYDALGKEVQRHGLSADRERYEFSTAPLLQGAYHYVVSNNVDIIGTGRLVIVR